jgi:lysozyme
MVMKINAAGLALLKHHEGCKLEAYLCPAGVPTIGFGHTGSGVKLGQKISQHQADVILEHDLERFEDCVERSMKGRPLNENQFSALVSLCFNVGELNFVNSTLRKLALRGDFAGAAAEFGRWVHGGGKVLPGLVARRADERALFERPGDAVS